MLIKKDTILVLLVFILFLPILASAEIAFDFGLPMFGKEEVRFEQSKDAEFNIQLLKKYLSEQGDCVLCKLDAISKWVFLIKLSDTSRKAKLEKFSEKYFKCKKIKKMPKDLLISNIFAQGLLLAQKKDKDNSNKADEKFESLLLDAEDVVGEDPDYLIVKGLVFQMLRNRPNNYFTSMKPEEDLKRALSVLKKTAHYYFVMGQAFRFLGNKESSLFLSIASYEKASTLGKRNGKLQNTILGIYMGLHEGYQGQEKAEPFWLEEAVYKKILFLSPNNPYALNNLGYLYAEFGINKKLAQQLCRKASKLRPENPGFHDSYGWAAFKNRNYKTAEREFKASLKLRSGVYDPYYHLATLYYVNEKFDLAIDNYVKALQIRPNSAEALNNLAYLFAEQGKNTDDALKMSLKAVKISSTNASYLDTLGWIYYQKKEYAKSIKFLKKASQFAPGEPEILMHIGKVYLESSDFTLAIDYLKEAKKNNAPVKELENALYLAFGLRDRLSTLAEFHKIFGASVSKDKMCSLLSGLAQLYQEVGNYTKSIFYTKLCAKIKSGAIKLDKPLFPFYKLIKTKVQTANKAPTPRVIEKSKLKSSATNKFHFAQEILSKKLTPLAIYFGPKFFHYASKYLPFCKAFYSNSIAIFVGNVFYPAKSFTIKLSGKKSEGKILQKLADTFFIQLNAKKTTTKNSNLQVYKFGKFNVYSIVRNASVYFSFENSFDKYDINFLDKIFQYKSDGFVEVILNWKTISNDIPTFLLPFVYNPFAPFTFVYSKYSMKKGSLKEFSALVMDKEVSDAFMKSFTRKLLVFKLRTKQLGLSTTIQTKKEGKTVYVSTYFENMESYVAKTLTPYAFIFKFLLSDIVNKYICFVDRLFYQSASELCPSGGVVTVNPYSGVISCSKHLAQPVFPFFTKASELCKYSCLRLQKLLKNSKLKSKEKKSIEKLVNKLIQDYNIPLCPDRGIFSVDDKGTVGCNKHK